MRRGLGLSVFFTLCMSAATLWAGAHLVSYAADYRDLFWRAAGYIFRIVKGIPPSGGPQRASSDLRSRLTSWPGQSLQKQ